MTTPTVPFVDLRPGAELPDLRAALERVAASGWYVLGPEVEAFEREFAAASGARHAVAVGNGTDAIALALRGLGIGSGDEVIVPGLTAAFTALAVASVGARPVIVDVDPERLTMDPRACAGAVTTSTRAIVPVHLYGQAADLDALSALARRHGLAIVEDCCQAHLARAQGVPVGTQGAAGAFSFYPTKNLGGLGDGGAVVTSDGALADRLRRLRNGGQEGRARHVEVGINSRLDELQAAVLRVRLAHLPGWTARRRALADAYRRRLPPGLALPERDPGHVYHLFVLRSTGRDDLQSHLRQAGIDTLVHYPVALTRQAAFAQLNPAACPEAERAADEVLSLPLYPTLSDEALSRVAEAVTVWAGQRMHA